MATSWEGLHENTQMSENPIFDSGDIRVKTRLYCSSKAMRDCSTLCPGCVYSYGQTGQNAAARAAVEFVPHFYYASWDFFRKKFPDDCADKKTPGFSPGDVCCFNRAYHVSF
jgi:hypothetical protein